MSLDDGHTIEVPQAMDVLQSELGILRTKLHDDEKTLMREDYDRRLDFIKPKNQPHFWYQF